MRNDNKTQNMTLKVRIKKKLKNFILDINITDLEEMSGLFGGSGSGKSMIFKCIAGLEEADEGYIEWNGKVLYDSVRGIYIKPQDRKIGYLSQSYGLFPNMTVRQNIKIVMKKTPFYEKKLEELIHRFQLNDLQNSYPHQLSGGQKQRVALARILAYEPELLLLDEPFTALDGYLKDEVYEEFHSLLKEYKGKIFLISHDKEEIYRFSKSLYVLYDGKIVESGTTKAVFEHPNHVVTAKLLGYKNIWPMDNRYLGFHSRNLRYLGWDIQVDMSRWTVDNPVLCCIVEHVIECSNGYDIALSIVAYKSKTNYFIKNQVIHWILDKSNDIFSLDNVDQQQYHYYVVNEIYELQSTD